MKFISNEIRFCVYNSKVFTLLPTSGNLPDPKTRRDEGTRAALCLEWKRGKKAWVGEERLILFMNLMNMNDAGDFLKQ